MWRKTVCSGNIHDLAHIPTQNCLTYYWTKASGKTDNLIIAVKTGRLLDVDIHPDFRTFMEHKALSTWCGTFMHTVLNALKISLTSTLQEGPCPGLLIYLIQNTYAHKGETCFLPEFSEDSSYTNSTGRTVPCDVCQKPTY